MPEAIRISDVGAWGGLALRTRSRRRAGDTLLPRTGSTTRATASLAVRTEYAIELCWRHVSDLYGEAFGVNRLSKSTVSRVTQHLNHEFETWRRRDLSELKGVYLFLDGQYHAARQGTDEKEGVLSA